MSDQPRAARLDRALSELLGQAPELEAAAVVSFDGLAMASALPAGMDEDRVAAMSAALLSLGEKAAQGLGRGDLSQVYVEGETGTVFLVSCEDQAVLVAVAAAGAKAGLMLFEVRHAAAAVGRILRDDTAPPAEPEVDPEALAAAEAAYEAHRAAEAARAVTAAPTSAVVFPAPVPPAAAPPVGVPPVPVAVPPVALPVAAPAPDFAPYAGQAPSWPA